MTEYRNMTAVSVLLTDCGSDGPVKLSQTKTNMTSWLPVPDMVVVHPLEERVGLDLLHSCRPDPVLLLTAEPAGITKQHTCCE